MNCISIGKAFGEDLRPSNIEGSIHSHPFPRALISRKQSWARLYCGLGFSCGMHSFLWCHPFFKQRKVVYKSVYCWSVDEMREAFISCITLHLDDGASLLKQGFDWIKPNKPHLPIPYRLRKDNLVRHKLSNELYKKIAEYWTITFSQCVSLRRPCWRRKFKAFHQVWHDS